MGSDICTPWLRIHRAKSTMSRSLWAVRSAADVFPAAVVPVWPGRLATEGVDETEEQAAVTTPVAPTMTTMIRARPTPGTTRRHRRHHAAIRLVSIGHLRAV